jgi:hypothetical protein
VLVASHCAGWVLESERMGQGDYDSQRGSVGVISVELNEET